RPLFCAAVCFGTLWAQTPMPLGLRTVGVRFHQGEAIPFTVEIPPIPQANRTYQFEGFLMTPSALCGSLNRICHIDRPGGLSNPSYPYLEGDLNRYLPGLLAPGHYRITAIWDVEQLKAASPMGRTFGFMNPRQYIVSKSAEFDVIAATPEWRRETIAAAVKTLVQGDSYEPVQMRMEAARRLRYIETPQ